MSQFDLKDWWVRETNFTRRADEPVARPYSVLQCVFLLQRHTGYFLIQVSRTGRERGLLCAFRSTFPAPSLSFSLGLDSGSTERPLQTASL